MSMLINGYIVVAGNPINGFSYFGPFADSDAALAWARASIEVEWWAVKLEGPVRFVPETA